MKLKKIKKRMNLLTYNLIIISLAILLSLYLIAYFSKQSEKILLPYTKLIITKEINNIINHSTDDIDFINKLYNLDIQDKEIKMVNYSTKEVVKLLDKVTFNIEDKLSNTENNNIYGEVPLGILFNNAMLANLGPKIKLKFIFLSSVISKVETEIKPYGINNAYLEMRIHVSVIGRIVLPLVSEEITINNVVPISISVVNGKVPEAYISSYK